MFKGYPTYETTVRVSGNSKLGRRLAEAVGSWRKRGDIDLADFEEIIVSHQIPDELAHAAHVAIYSTGLTYGVAPCTYGDLVRSREVAL